MLRAKSQTGSIHKLKSSTHEATYGAAYFRELRPSLENHAKRNTRSWKETVRILENEFVSKVGQLSASDKYLSGRSMSRVNEIASNNGPSAGNHAFSVIRRFSNWCCRNKGISIILRVWG